MYLWDIVLKDICSKYKNIKEKIRFAYDNTDIIIVYRDQLIEDMNRVTNAYKDIKHKTESLKYDKDNIKDKQVKLFSDMISCRVEYECITLCLQYMSGVQNDDSFEVEMMKVYNDTIKKKYINIFKRFERS